MLDYGIKITVTVAVLTFTFATPAQASETTYDEVKTWLAEHAYAPTDGVRAGTYTVDGLAKLRAYLPPGFAGLFDFPELVVEIMETQHYAPTQVYRMATEQFAGTARIGPDGRLESHTVGRPFSASQVEAAPLEQAGYMVAWNHIFRWQHYGYSARSLLSYVESGAGGTQTAGMGRWRLGHALDDSRLSPCLSGQAGAGSRRRLPLRYRRQGRSVLGGVPRISHTLRRRRFKVRD